MQNGIIDGISIKPHEPCIPYLSLNEQLFILTSKTWLPETRSKLEVALPGSTPFLKGQQFIKS